MAIDALVRMTTRNILVLGAETEELLSLMEVELSAA